MPQRRGPAPENIRLYGFNNLTKTLSFNLYDICYARTRRDSREYIAYIDEVYNARRLTDILTEVSDIIGSRILNIAGQDYEPQGASVAILISEEDEPESGGSDAAAEMDEAPGPLPETVLGHLDKSHITVHTYPEKHPYQGICTFRADIDVSTCGQISPLKALNYLVHTFNPDISVIDYRVRGFTRAEDGEKLFIDHSINSIQNFIARETLDRYQMVDTNIYQENIFQTKMLLREFQLDDYLFGAGEAELQPAEKTRIRRALRKEMLEIYSGRNIPSLPEERQ
ncbi:MAG: adenosylmethionine decarboxylase [Synergistales bacterium]|nr:adenosylmethionine decarboxylase [Synergistales bacterium]